MSYCVGLTGGIGSGKSTVAAMFADLDVPVIDTDIISHQLTQSGGAAISAIQGAFGKEYLDADGALNRIKMRELVFSDPASKERLENILHPLILAETKKQASVSPSPYVLIVVPLLFESKTYLDWLDRTVTVDCTETAQYARASRREGLSEQTVKAIIAQQMTRPQRLALADDVIQNDGSISDLHMQVAALNRQYLNLAQSNN